MFYRRNKSIFCWFLKACKAEMTKLQFSLFVFAVASSEMYILVEKDLAVKRTKHNLTKPRYSKSMENLWLSKYPLAIFKTNVHHSKFFLKF